MDGSDPGFIYTVLQFLLLLSILVFVHEWGHYIVARIFKTRVDVFSIGFGRERRYHGLGIATTQPGAATQIDSRPQQ